VWSRRVLQAAAIGCLTVLLFVFLEGAASLTLFLHGLWNDVEKTSLTEQRHTRYDSELGWVSLPNIRVDDMYGPGKHLVTNGRGFRNVDEVDVHESPGRRRVICSGDSFTLGFGVSNDETWCSLLGQLEERWEPVNMGQGGYGVDQAYLWHARDGSDLDRTVHLFAFIGDDFNRMQSDHFLGYGKPVMILENSALKTANTPVPQTSSVSRWAVQNGHLFRRLRVVDATSRVVRRLSGDGQRSEPVDGGNQEERTSGVARAVFDSLLAENQSKGAALVLLLLPTPWDYHSDVYEQWHRLVRDYAETNNVLLIDMIDELRSLDETAATQLFFSWGEVGAPHFNEEGNRWVAQHVSERISRWLE
jgi:hypothetical protein